MAQEPLEKQNESLRFGNRGLKLADAEEEKQVRLARVMRQL